MPAGSDEQPSPDSAPGAAVARILRYEADIAFRRRARTIVEYLAPQKDDRILDAGCGLGFYLRLLSLVSEAPLYGIDLAGPRLGAAVADREASSASLVAGDVTRLPYRDDSFDKMLLSEVLEHLPDDRPALAEARRILRPGGILAISVPHVDYPFLWDPLNRTRDWLGLGHFTSEPWSGIWTDHQRLYDEAELSERVGAAGFRIEHVSLETRYSAPFAHHFVYGLGKLIVDRQLAGKSNGNRYELWAGGSASPLVKALVALFTFSDRLNRDRYSRGPVVSLCLKAVCP